MIRKALVLLAPVTVVLAVALAPVSATADLKCPKGTSDPTYCKRKCVVPELRGLTVRQAQEELEEHDCDLGQVEKCKADRHRGGNDFSRNWDNRDPCAGVEKGRVLRSDPPAGTVLPNDADVDVVVRSGGSDHGHGHD